MSKFYIVFHENKHGQDLVYCDSLDEAKIEAKRLTDKHYSDYATSYKEVCNQGCYDNIYIRSISLTNDAIKKEDLQELFIKLVVNPGNLKIEDNELDLNLYPNIQYIMNKYGFLMSYGPYSYYKGYRFVDPVNDNCVLFTSEYLHDKKVPVIKSDIGVKNVPHYCQRYFSIEEKNQYDNSISMKELDKFCELIKNENFKLTRILATNKDHVDLYNKEFTVLHD